jgi:hypothetical protein
MLYLDNPDVRTTLSSMLLEDLVYLTKEELVDSASTPIGKLFLRVIIPKYLEHFIDIQDETQEFVRAITSTVRFATIPSERIPYKSSPDGTVLDFKSVVHSSIPATLSKFRFSIRELIDNISEIQTEKVTWIDFRECGLIDDDIPDLVEFVSHFPSENLVLSLRQNMFTDITPLLETHVKWIDVCNNKQPLKQGIHVNLEVIDSSSLSESEILNHLTYYHTVYITGTDMTDLMRRHIAKPRKRRTEYTTNELLTLCSYKKAFDSCRFEGQRYALARKIAEELGFLSGEVYTWMFSN